MKKGLCTIAMACILCATAGMAETWTAGDITVDVTKDPMNIKLTADGKTLLEATAITFNTNTVNSIDNVTVSSNTMTLTSGSYTIDITQVHRGIRFFSAPSGLGNVTITLKDQGEHFYGVQEKFQSDNDRSPDLRGKRIDVEMADDNADGFENWASAWSAFYMTNLGYGSFFNTLATGNYKFGIDNETELRHEADTLDWYIFYGPQGHKIHEGYFSVIGEPKNVPIWACGVSFWKDVYNNYQEVLSDIDNFASNEFPSTHFWIDRPYSEGESGWGRMNWSPYFAGDAWVDTIRQGHNLRFSTWIAPCTFGNTCEGCWSGGFTYIDLSNPQGVSFFKDKLITYQYPKGVDGHKMDRAEEGMEMQQWYDGTPQEKRKNKYVYLYAKVVSDVLDSVRGADHFMFARAAYHGTQKYLNAIWGGDSRSPYEGYAGSLANAMRCSYMGFPVWGSDIGSYLDKTKIDETAFTRWLQFGVWSGFTEIMLDNREPWTYSSDFKTNFRNLCEQRMRLIPYIYSLANTSADNGVLMRPMTYAYPSDEATYDMWDQYMLGPVFLVAPIIDRSTQRSVYLPEGEWYDYRAIGDAPFAGQQTITANAPESEIPVYVKKNSIFTTGLIYAGNMIRWENDFASQRQLEVNVFPGDPGDTARFTYVDYYRNIASGSLSFTEEAHKEITSFVDGNGHIYVYLEPVDSIDGVVKIRVDDQPDHVYINKTPVSNIDYNATEKTVQVPFSSASGTVIQVGGTEPAVRYGMSNRAITQLRVNADARGIYLSNIADGIQGQQLHAHVFTVDGVRVATKRVNVQGDRSQKLLDAKTAAAGMYLITIMSQAENTSFKRTFKCLLPIQ